MKKQTKVLYFKKTIDKEQAFVYNVIVEQTFRTYVRGDNMKKKYKITNKRKFISFLLLVSTMVMCMTFLLVKDNKVYSSTYEENYMKIKVVQGDTLWNIAINNMPKEYDVRKMVFEIMEFNHMKDAYIYPGNKIKIPIKYNPN